MHMYSQSFIHLFIYSFIHVCIYSFIHYVSIDCYSPHHCVGLLFFAWHPPLLPHPAAPLPTSHSPLITSHSSHHNSSQHPFSHLSHHSTTYHTTCHSHIITQHSSQHYLSHHLSQQSHRGWLSGGAAACFVWQAQYTGPAGGAAARVVAACPAAGVRVAGAMHRAFWRRCCARGRRLARGWLSCGRRTTHSLLEELLRAAGFRVARAAARVVATWPAYTGPSGGAAARVVAGWPAAGFHVAGAVHTAFWRSCCARSRRLAGGWRSCGRRNTQGLLEALLRAWSPAGPRQAQYTEQLLRAWFAAGPRLAFVSNPEELLRAWLPAGPRLAFVWQAQYTQPSGGAAARVVAGWPAAGFRVARAAARVVAAWPAYTGPSGGAAARVVAGWPAAGFRVAGAVPRACWRSCCAHGRGWLSYGMRSTQSLLEELVRAWPLLARGWLSCGRRSTQSLPEELLSHHFVTPLCHTHTHHLSHIIFHTTLSHTPSFTRHH